jgi:hypothetical protein
VTVVAEGLRAGGFIGTLTPANDVTPARQHLCRDAGGFARGSAGPNHSLLYPRSAVGVVTRSPAVTGENFLFRFSDGFEKTLERSQIEVF